MHVIMWTQIEKRMKKIIQGRLQSTEETCGERSLPRIIRLCRKFKLTEMESLIAIYSLVTQSSTERTGRYTDVLSTCGFLKIPLKVMLEFLNKDRLHMQQGLFPEVEEAYILNSTLSYDTDFCKALMGSQLKSNEFLKLEQTLLADVIAEEPGNECYRYLNSCRT